MVQLEFVAIAIAISIERFGSGDDSDGKRRGYTSRSKQATVSIWLVCGNMSTGWIMVRR